MTDVHTLMHHYIIKIYMTFPQQLVLWLLKTWEVCLASCLIGFSLSKASVFSRRSVKPPLRPAVLLAPSGPYPLRSPSQYNDERSQWTNTADSDVYGLYSRTCSTMFVKYKDPVGTWKHHDIPQASFKWYCWLFLLTHEFEFKWDFFCFKYTDTASHHCRLLPNIII